MDEISIATISQGIRHASRCFASVGLFVALAVGRLAKRRHRAAAMARAAASRAYGEWESPITAIGWQEELEVYSDVMKDSGVWGI